MPKNEFRWNKKRRHYSYIHKRVGSKRVNILITSKAVMIEKKNKKKIKITHNVPLYHHPNPNKEGRYYLIPINYIDDIESFDIHIYEKWIFDRNDKRKVKRIKKIKK